MKTLIKNLFLLPALIAGLGLIPAGRATAQTFTTLYSFTATSSPYSTNSDGANPVAGLILSGTTLYGTASQGGSSGYGTILNLAYPQRPRVPALRHRPVWSRGSRQKVPRTTCLV